jgi:hypothetical protein
VLVVSRNPLRPKFLKPADTAAKLTRIPRTGELHRLRRSPAHPIAEISFDTDGRPDSWPEPVAEIIPEKFERESPGCLARRFGSSENPPVEVVTRLDFSRGDPVHSGSGWARPKKREDGTTWSLVEGPEASVDLEFSEATRHTIAVRIAPVSDLTETQWIRVVLNGHVLGEKPLNRGSQTVRFNAPARLWRGGRALLVLQFSQVASGDGKRPSRSAAVDWIDWTPSAEAVGG